MPVHPSVPDRPAIPYHGSFDLGVARGPQPFQHVGKLVHARQLIGGEVLVAELLADMDRYSVGMEADFAGVLGLIST
jgi:hypothetical protein